MQIRRAESADEEILVKVRLAAILELAVPAISAEHAEKWATRAPPDRVARAIREHDVWVAVDGVPIGWVEVNRDFVAALYVSPRSSCRGVGSALLAVAENEVRRFGYATVRLEASQNAIDFYVRRGYSRTGPCVSGAWPLSKVLPARVPNPPLQATGSAGGGRSTLAGRPERLLDAGP